MRSVIQLASGRAVDLAGPVGPDLYAELESITSHRADPALRCGACHGGIYLQHGRRNRDVLFGCHHHAGDCPATFAVRRAAPMSDEHKRQAEYHAVAAERAGHAADLEVTTTGRTRVDVVVDGRFGIEVQRSALSKSAAADRTARSVAAGLAVVAWFTGTPGSPLWSGHVPGYRTAARADGWTALPLPGSVTAAGLQVFEALRCGAAAPCFHRPGMCPGYVPQLAAWCGIHVDDVVTGLAEETIRPVVYAAYVRLMPAASIALYEELTGIPLPAYDAVRPRARQLRPAPRAECDRAPAPPPPTPPPPPPRLLVDTAGAPWPPPPAPYRPSPGRCQVPGCGRDWPVRLYPGGWFCALHQPGRHTRPSLTGRTMTP